MTYSDEHVARLEAQADAAATERRQLRSIIAELRGALGTPENASVVQHARDVVAEAQRARDDLAQALHDAEKWRAVPWDVIGSIVFDWELTNDIDDAMHDLRTWYDRSKPEEVTAE